MTDEQWIEAAREHRLPDDVEIDDNAKVSVADDGKSAWVQAWVWVQQPGGTE